MPNNIINIRALNRIAADRSTIGDVLNIPCESATDYTTVFTTAALAQSGCDIQVSGGNGTLQYFYYANYGATSLGSWVQRRKFQVKTKPATNAGIGLGITGVANNFYAYVDLTSGANSGKILIYGATLAKTSASAIVFSVDDEMEIIVTRTEFTCSVTVNNLTTSTTLTDSFAFLTVYPASVVIGSTGYWCTIAIGGTQLIHNYNISSTEPYKPYYLFRGDSILAAYWNAVEACRYTNLIDIGTDRTVMNQGSSSETTAIALLNIYEIVNIIKPRTIVWCGLGSNDIANAVPTATWKANILNFATQCKAVGISFIWADATPRDATDIRPLGDYYTSDFATDQRITEPFDLLKTGAFALHNTYDITDGIHPNEFAQYTLNNIYRSKIAGLASESTLIGDTLKSGSVLDTSKWLLRNNTSGVTIAQVNGTGVVATMSHTVNPVSNFPESLMSRFTFKGTFMMVQMYIDWTDPGAVAQQARVFANIYFDAFNYARLDNLGTGNNTFRFYYALAGTTAGVTNTGITKGKHIKITYDTTTNDMKWWYWSGAAWTQMGVTQNANIDQGYGIAASPFIFFTDSAGFLFGDTLTVSDFYASDHDSATLIPT